MTAVFEPAVPRILQVLQAKNNGVVANTPDY